MEVNMWDRLEMDSGTVVAHSTFPMETSTRATTRIMWERVAVLTTLPMATNTKVYIWKDILLPNPFLIKIRFCAKSRSKWPKDTRLPIGCLSKNYSILDSRIFWKSWKNIFIIRIINLFIATFEGEFFKDKKDGHGVFTSKNGDRLECNLIRN